MRCEELCECEYEPQRWNLYTHRRQLDNIHIVCFAGIACIVHPSFFGGNTLDRIPLFCFVLFPVPR